MMTVSWRQNETCFLNPNNFLQEFIDDAQMHKWIQEGEFQHHPHLSFVLSDLRISGTHGCFQNLFPVKCKLVDNKWPICNWVLVVSLFIIAQCIFYKEYHKYKIISSSWENDIIGISIWGDVCSASMDPCLTG